MDTQNTTSATLAPAPARPPARNRYAYLYMPLITGVLVLAIPPLFRYLIRYRSHPWNASLVLAFLTLSTYFLGSTLHSPDTVPWDGVRFTRKHEAIRALVLFTYGRWFGTPINFKFIIADFVSSYFVAEYLVGEPARQRRSEFLVALMWVLGNGALCTVVPQEWAQVYLIVGMVDRVLWRTAYLALVDDVVSVLARPDVRSARGRAVLMVVQGFTIVSLVGGGMVAVKRLMDARSGKAM